MHSLNGCKEHDILEEIVGGVANKGGIINVEPIKCTCSVAARSKLERDIGNCRRCSDKGTF